MLALRKSQTWSEGSLEGFRPRRHLPLPAPRRLCAGGPLGACFSLIPVALPHHTRTIPQQKRLPLPPAMIHQSQITKSFTIRTSAKCARNSFRIRTSKTQDLKPFRMNTSEKTPGGSPPSHPFFVLLCPPLPSRGTAHQTRGCVMGGLFFLQLSTFDVRLFKYNPRTLFPGDR
jgi:hypothetical protein